MIVTKPDMIDEIMVGLEKLPHKYVRLVLIFVRGLLRD